MCKGYLSVRVEFIIKVMKMKLNSKIGAWINKRGFKNNYVAKQLGVSENTLSRWVNNKSIPSVKTLFKLAVLLDCKTDDLYERTD